MTSVVRLRMISLAGSVAFVVYGVLIESVPIIVTNVAIAALNVWFLRNELGGRRDARCHRRAGRLALPGRLPALPPRRHPPIPARLRAAARAGRLVAMLLMRDGLPAGRPRSAGSGGATCSCVLDHVTKPYRDSQISTWLFGRGSAVFRRMGVDRLVRRRAPMRTAPTWSAWGSPVRARRCTCWTCPDHRRGDEPRTGDPAIDTRYRRRLPHRSGSHGVPAPCRLRLRLRRAWYHRPRRRPRWWSAPVTARCWRSLVVATGGVGGRPCRRRGGQPTRTRRTAARRTPSTLGLVQAEPTCRAACRRWTCTPRPARSVPAW